MAATPAMGDDRSSSSRVFSIRQSLYRPKILPASTTSSSGPQPLRPAEEEGLACSSPASPVAPPALPSESTKQARLPHRSSFSSSVDTPTSSITSSLPAALSRTRSLFRNGSTDNIKPFAKQPTTELENTDLNQIPEQANASNTTQPKITLSKFARSSKTVSMNDTSYRPGLDALENRNRPVSDTFSSFTRMPWNSPSVSRSPSPSSRDEQSSKDEDDSTTASSVSSSTNGKLNRKKSAPVVNSSVLQERPKLFRSPSSFTKKSRKPLSMLMKASVSDTSVPLSAVEAPTASPFKSATVSGSSSRKVIKDELWEGFKALENDHQKFQSKSNLQKSSIIRQSVLPFLRKSKDIPSRVSPEILEKRVRTLHRWWTGLLAQMKNRSPQAMTGTDRPLYLDAISYIMSRPEWRCGASTFAPLAQRTPSTAKSASTSSLSSVSSDYSIQKSVQHNIKVLFTRTLYDTLAYIVEKMGLRSAPPVMVAFGGKVLAYAFYFCPGVAEMLINLWGLQPNVIRRVLSQFEIGRGTDLRGVSENIVAEFPETLHALGLTTLSSLTRQLKKPTKPPVAVQIDWYGPWTSRWCGRDSDLLFVFLKYHHVLMCEYLPADVSVTARLCAPGYVSVLAQILTLLENTIQRQPGQAGPEISTASTTFEDLLNATATLPLPGRNAPRTMAENKSVVLLQDVLSAKICSEFCRGIFVPSFVAMLKAAVERTSLYNADACFQLVDLMEEVLPILARAEHVNKVRYIDWNFWVGVMKTMSQSENNMTELRLISFLYTAWDLIVSEESRKRNFVIDWLLSPTVWDRFFCHWCPMTRAYYMRLLCWRVGRYDGDPNALDLDIYKTMFIRLRTCYAYHLRLKDNAKNNKGPPSSTAPCLPAPSRRLVILRNDALTVSQGVILDGIVPTSTSFPASQPLSRSSSTGSLASLAENDPHSDPTGNDAPSTEPAARRWSSIRNVFSFKSALANGTSAGSGSPPASPPATSGSSTSSNESPVVEEPRLPSGATFKFSLEWLDRPVFGSRERIIGPSRLAAPAQKYLDASSVNLDDIKVSEKDLKAKHWTYVGRALAEWVLVIMEHENFFERRKTEGRATDKDVETPSLGVDSVRKF